MKHSFFFFSFFIASLPCTAQWKTATMPAQVLAFGVHDTVFFLSTVGEGNGPSVQRFVPMGHPLPYYWTECDTGIGFSGGNIVSFSSLGRYFYANQQGQDQFTFRSSDNGSTWNEVGGGVNIASNGYYLFGNYEYFGRHYFGLSRDSGMTWDSVENSVAQTYATIGKCIFVNNGSAIMRSQDTGDLNTWSQLSPPFVGAMTTMGSLLFITGGGKVIESTDSGTQWGPVAVDSGGTVPETVNVLVSDGKNLFAGTTKGVYFSMDTGKHWLAGNQGLTYLNVDALGVFDTLLFVNTPASGGAYYTAMRSIPEMTDTTPSSVVQTLPPGDTIEIYPNPATGMVTIMAGGTSILGITVLNVLGENVLALPNLRESEFSFDLSKLPSGTYFLRIETSNGSVLRTMVMQH